MIWWYTISHGQANSKSTAPAAPGILIEANIMQVRSTAKFFAFTGKFQTPEGGFGQATAYVKKETWAKTAQHYGWGVNALPADKIADGGTLSEVLFDRCMIARLVWS